MVTRKSRLSLLLALGLALVQAEVGRSVAEADDITALMGRAAAGDAASQASLGHIFYKGTGVLQDRRKAVKYYRRAAEQGNAEAQFGLGNCYHGYGVPRDDREVVRWYRKAAEQGHVKAQLSLGVYYSNGLHVPKDEREGVKWTRKAAEQGLAPAQHNLGGYYHKGRGVPQNFQEMVKWFRKAAVQNFLDSQKDLAACYYLGRGVPKDYAASYAWYNLAAAQGDKKAKECRANLSLQLTANQIAAAQQLSRQLSAQIQKAKRSKLQSSESAPAPSNRPAQVVSTGTGFFITDAGYLLTNYHVIAKASKISVRTANGVLPARLVKADTTNDLAVLKVEGRFKALPLTSSRFARLGNSVFTIGFPNTQIQGTEPKYTSGRINSLSGIKDDPRQFQVSVPIQPGNSGGPLVDLQGNVVGVIVAQLNGIKVLKASGSLPQNVNYAVKSSFALAFLETLPDVVAKLKRPNAAEVANTRGLVRLVQDATVMIRVEKSAVQTAGFSPPERK